MRIRRIAALLCACLMLYAPALGEDTAAPETAAAGEEQAGAATVYEPLSSGAKGDEVRRMQERLTELGYSPGTADGIFGSGTKSAVKAFQRRNKLEADGVAGVRTLAALYYDPDEVGAVR